MKCCGNKKKEKIEESINSGNVKENKNNLNVKENESNGNENEKIKDIKEEKKYYYHRRKKKKIMKKNNLKKKKKKKIMIYDFHNLVMLVEMTLQKRIWWKLEMDTLSKFNSKMEI